MLQIPGGPKCRKQLNNMLNDIPGDGVTPAFSQAEIGSSIHASRRDSRDQSENLPKFWLYTTSFKEKIEKINIQFDTNKRFNKILYFHCWYHVHTWLYINVIDFS